jgi:hypothetical protein
MNNLDRRRELVERIKYLRGSSRDIDLGKASVEEMEQWLEERKRQVARKKLARDVGVLKLVAHNLKIDLGAIETDTAPTEEIEAWIASTQGKIGLTQKAEGMKLGEQKYQRDRELGVYPLQGLPIDRTDRTDEWIEGYQLSYYQDLQHSKPELLESDRVDITISVSQQLLDAASLAGICPTEAIERGLVDLLNLYSGGS